MQISRTYDKRTTEIMLKKPITKLARLIGRKWFLSLETLVERTGVPLGTIKRAVEGEYIGGDNGQKLTAYLESYKGEIAGN